MSIHSLLLHLFLLAGLIKTVTSSATTAAMETMEMSPATGVISEASTAAAAQQMTTMEDKSAGTMATATVTSWTVIVFSFILV